MIIWQHYVKTARGMLSIFCFPISTRPRWMQLTSCKHSWYRGDCVPNESDFFSQRGRSSPCLSSSLLSQKRKNSTSKKNLSSERTNLTNAGLGVPDMCPSKLSNCWSSKANFDTILQEIPWSSSPGKWWVIPMTDF